MPWMPSAAIARNQPSMIGPKIPPMKAAPFFWTANRASRMTTVSGTTTGARTGASTFRPSRALRTEIAGVMAPSP